MDLHRLRGGMPGYKRSRSRDGKHTAVLGRMAAIMVSRFAFMPATAFLLVRLGTLRPCCVPCLPAAVTS